MLRGVIMVVMALDHTRDFFHWGAIHGFEPTDLATTTPGLFFTRWATHFCAPTFQLLAGTGAFFFTLRGRPTRELSWFLVSRGVWLIFLELTLLTWFGWSFGIDLKSYTFATLWALGWSMILLAALVHLPMRLIAIFGLVLIFGHNAFDAVKPESWGAWSGLWKLLHVSSQIEGPGGVTFTAFYPLVPWVGVMAAGYALGSIYRWEAAVRRRWLLRAGVAAIAAFMLLRWSNVYGNLWPWTPQSRGPIFTLLSFLNVTKYPPSLCYLLMTLGPGLIALSLLDGGTPKLLKPFLVYGRVPFFYYVLHIPLLHALAVMASSLWRGDASFLFARHAGNPPPDAGFSLPVIYLVWLAVVLAFYPACKWFGELKRRHRSVWLSYL